MKATRDSFGEAIVELGEQDKRLVVLDADLSKSTKSEAFGKKFPDRFFQMGIAEANMIGTAAGLALEGKIPFLCSFACFLTGRYDQIRMSVAYNRANVKLVGTHAGVAIGEDGHSQMGLEDVALLRSLPHFQIFQPVDDAEAKSCLKYMASSKGPSYIRLTRQKMPSVSQVNQAFQPGKWPILREGKEIAVMASGQLFHSCAEAMAQAKESWTLVNASSLKPVDRACIERLAKTHRLLVTAEDHYVTGGLGSAVAEELSTMKLGVPLLRIGVDEFGESGSPEAVYRHFGLDATGVLKKIQAGRLEMLN